MRNLGSLTLPEGVVWVNQHQWVNVRRNNRITISGKAISYAQPLITGQTIILNFDNGWLNHLEKDYLLNMASQPLIKLQFIWDNFSKYITFTEKIGIIPLIGMKNEADDFFVGEIELITL